MSVLAKAVAMLAAASPEEVKRLPPAERRRLADTLRHWLAVVEPPKGPAVPAIPRSGVLADLRIQRQEWR